MKGIVITTDNKISVKDFSSPLYKSVGEVVGGYIEIVHPSGLQQPYCMIVNEEGLLLGLSLNNVGCFFYRTLQHGHPIVGDIVIMQDGFVNGEPDIVGIPDDEVYKIAAQFKAVFNLKGDITNDQKPE